MLTHDIQQKQVQILQCSEIGFCNLIDIIIILFFFLGPCRAGVLIPLTMTDPQ